MNFQQQLQTINQNNPLPTQHLDELLQFMVEHIGDINSELRDQLIYGSFCRLILENSLSLKQESNLLEALINDNYLYLDIYDLSNEDAVFTRSFSALTIAQLLHKDSKAKALPKELVIQALNRSLHYLQLEHDYRGFFEKKGWAHAVAHGADLLAIALSHPYVIELDFTQITLNALAHCLNTTYPFIDEEDERMLPVFDALHDLGLTDKQLTNWIQQLTVPPEVDEDTKYRKSWNLKKCKQTLYVHLVKTNKYPETAKFVLENLY